jgi:hypothetical protein
MDSTEYEKIRGYTQQGDFISVVTKIEYTYTDRWTDTVGYTDSKMISKASFYLIFKNSELGSEFICSRYNGASPYLG